MNNVLKWLSKPHGQLVRNVHRVLEVVRHQWVKENVGLAKRNSYRIGNIGLVEVKEVVSRAQESKRLSISWLCREVAKVGKWLAKMEAGSDGKAAAIQASYEKLPRGHSKYHEEPWTDVIKLHYTKEVKGDVGQLEEEPTEAETLPKLGDDGESVGKPSWRACDADCAKMPMRWGSRLHNRLKVICRQLNPSGKTRLTALLQRLFELDHCPLCLNASAESSYRCENENNCQDVIRLMRRVQVHVPFVRSLLRQVYRMRAVAWQQLLPLAEALSGNWKLLKQVTFL